MLWWWNGWSGSDHSFSGIFFVCFVVDARSAFKRSRMSVVYEVMLSALPVHLHNHETDTNYSHQTLFTQDKKIHMFSVVIT